MIYDIGDEPKNLYVVLSGAVSVRIKNPLIKTWDWAQKVKKSLEDWKVKVFDPKCERAMQMHVLKAKLQTDALQVKKLNQFDNESKQAMHSKWLKN